MILYPDKCFYICKIYKCFDIILSDNIKKLLAFECEVLGITVEFKLTALGIRNNYLRTLQVNLIHLQGLSFILIRNRYNFFIILFFSKESYCRLSSTSCSRFSNHLHSNVQGRLKMVYSDYDANFRELLEIANENTILVKAPIPQLSTNCLSVFDHLVGLALKCLIQDHEHLNISPQ